MGGWSRVILGMSCLFWASAQGAVGTLARPEPWGLRFKVRGDWVKRSKWSVLAGGVGVLTFGFGSALAGSPAQAADPSTMGNAPDNAAGSCWEIKQNQPAAPNGDYWVVTPTLTEPMQVYCDMTTDGGGWELIAKGRDGWTDHYEGAGAPADLLTPDLSVMSAKTTQYPSPVVDGLLGGGRVDGLADGIRLRRAKDTSGTSWQETRFKMLNTDRWVWTFPAEHAVGSFSFDGQSGSGGTTANFGSDTTYRRVTTTASSAQLYHLGFAYGSRVAGSSSSTSYLWSATNNGVGALPYTQMYIRPHVTSTAGFTSIGDGGTAGFNQPAVPRSLALDNPWGVTGIQGNAATEGNVEVQAFTQSGNTMYVGGNFANVQQDAAGTGQVHQPFLAAFDVSTGQFIPTFHPQLNEQVHALATLADGTVVAGGEFTQANGSPATGIVALDPTTG